MKKLLKASAYFLEEALSLKLDERAQEGKITFILLNQPPLCDARCKRCFMPSARRGKIVNPLTLEESKYVLDRAAGYGVLCMEISGEGEPLLSENLLSIIKHASDLNILTTLITNGHNLSENIISTFFENKVTLVFSLHTLNKEKYEADNRLKGSFDIKMKNIELASKTFENSTEIVNGYEVMRLAVHATLQRDNFEEIAPLKSFCQERDIFFSVASLAEVGCALENPEILPDYDIPTIEQLANMGDNSIILSHSTKREVGREVCGTCFYGLNIGYDGNLLFDAHAGYEVAGILGNIRTTPFKELVRRQRIVVKALFTGIHGYCPVRDDDWQDFLNGVLSGKTVLFEEGYAKVGTSRF